MDIQLIPLGLRILIAVPLMFMAGSILSYFKSPEDYFIKRLRPKGDVKYTHAQLLFRAFIGLGLVWPALAFSGILIIVSDDAFIELRPEFVLSALPISLFSSIGSYIYFRLWRYVEIDPSEQDVLVSGGQRTFVRRASPNPKTWGLRLTLIIVFAVALVAGPAIMMVWSISMFELFG